MNLNLPMTESGHRPAPQQQDILLTCVLDTDSGRESQLSLKFEDTLETHIQHFRNSKRQLPHPRSPGAGEDAELKQALEKQQGFTQMIVHQFEALKKQHFQAQNHLTRLKQHNRALVQQVASQAQLIAQLQNQVHIQNTEMQKLANRKSVKSIGRGSKHKRINSSTTHYQQQDFVATLPSDPQSQLRKHIEGDLPTHFDSNLEAFSNLQTAHHDDAFFVPSRNLFPNDYLRFYTNELQQSLEPSGFLEIPALTRKQTQFSRTRQVSGHQTPLVSQSVDQFCELTQPKAKPSVAYQQFLATHLPTASGDIGQFEGGVGKQSMTCQGPATRRAYPTKS